MDVTPARKFRLRFWVVLLGVLVASQFLLVVFFTTFWMLSDGRVLLLRFTATDLNWLIFMGSMAVAAWAGWRVRVDPAGFEVARTFDPVAWDKVQGAELCRLLWLPYVRLTVRTHGTVRIPLCLQDLPGFVAAVEEFAGPDHPLTQTLNDWMNED